MRKSDKYQDGETQQSALCQKMTHQHDNITLNLLWENQFSHMNKEKSHGPVIQLTK